MSCVDLCVYESSDTFPLTLNKLTVHGKEYGFGAHDFPLSGVFEVEPRSCPGYTYRCSISLGRVNMPPEETRAFIEAMASEYHGDTYNLISKNCNHFSDDLSKRLIGKGIPRWVNRLAGLGNQMIYFLVISSSIVLRGGKFIVLGVFRCNV